MDKIKVIEQLRIDEGVVLKPYKDTVGKTTIGIGRNLDDVGITLQEAAFLCSNDIDSVTRDLDVNLSWWRSLTEARQNALVNMCFNLGIVRLLGFKKFIAALKTADYDIAADEMLDSKWAKQVKDRAVRLAKHIREGV